MSTVLNKVRDVDPNNSEAVKEVLTLFFQNLSKHTGLNCNQWLRTLETILNRYPKYCSSHKVTIETYLSLFLDRSNYYDVIQAAKCAHALLQVRWPQDKQVTSKSAWRDNMNLLCNSIHSLIDTLFNDTVDINQNDSKKIQLKSNFDSPLTDALIGISFTGPTGANHKKTLLETRLRNIFVFIQAMIVEIYSVPKPISPKTILDIIIHSISVTSAKKSLSNDISMVKTQALRTLDALIACLGTNLIPFSPLVFRIVMQTLRWSSDVNIEDARQVRCNAYNSLSNWLTTLHTYRFPPGNVWEDELISHVIGDTTPPKKTVQLNMSGQPLKNLSKKARRKLQNNMLKESTIATHAPGEKNKLVFNDETNNEVAMAALEFAETFLSVCGVFLKPNSHKMFQEHFVRECYNISTYSDEYVLLLLRVLEALRKTTPSTVPPPTQYCLELYSTVSNVQSKEISKFSSNALLDIRLHLHCSPPTINFALVVQPEKEKTVDKQKRISERNRAALEKFLGSDRMPKQNTSEEVITIPDEPLSKKPRLEEESDKISLSSESVCSVESHPDADSEDEGEETPQEVENDIDTNMETDPKEEISNKNENNIINTKSIAIEVEGHINETITKKMDSIFLEDTEESEKSQEPTPIHEAKTQLPLNNLNEVVDEEEQPPSVEVSYDYPNESNVKVTVLDKMDDENLPSTNETDDVQITCGQVVIPSQENELEKPKESDGTLTDVNVVVNGVKEANNEEINKAETGEENVTSKLTKKDEISVEEMLADFVDEVNEQAVDA
ncbi:chemotaxis regulatory protein ChePep-like [Battus philenor]|uniref:chemotaxis regulatory protein ChePep-like n=1 Tax=Battus philenor TaxID=42288 RepID=UPI0035D0B420